MAIIFARMGRVRERRKLAREADLGWPYWCP